MDLLLDWQVTKQHVFILCFMSHVNECVLHGDESFTSYSRVSLGCSSASPSSSLLSPDLLKDRPTVLSIFNFIYIFSTLFIRYVFIHENVKFYMTNPWNESPWRTVWAHQWLNKEHINIDLGASHILDKLPACPKPRGWAPDIWLRAGFTPVRWWSCSRACFSGGPNE